MRSARDGPVDDLLRAEEPFDAASRHCYACGDENERGLHMHVDLDHERHEAHSVVTLGPDLQGWDGVAHGGVVSTLMDEVLCYSLGERRPVFTVELTVRYKRAVPLGKPLTVRARRTLVRGRLMQAEGELSGPDGELLATAQGKFLRPRAGEGGGTP